MTELCLADSQVCAPYNLRQFKRRSPGDETQIRYLGEIKASGKNVMEASAWVFSSRVRSEQQDWHQFTVS